MATPAAAPAAAAAAQSTAAAPATAAAANFAAHQTSLAASVSQAPPSPITVNPAGADGPVTPAVEAARRLAFSPPSDMAGVEAAASAMREAIVEVLKQQQQTLSVSSEVLTSEARANSVDSIRAQSKSAKVECRSLRSQARLVLQQQQRPQQQEELKSGGSRRGRAAASPDKGTMPRPQLSNSSTASAADDDDDAGSAAAAGAAAAAPLKEAAPLPWSSPASPEAAQLVTRLRQGTMRALLSKNMHSLLQFADCARELLQVSKEAPHPIGLGADVSLWAAVSEAVTLQDRSMLASA